MHRNRAESVGRGTQSVKFAGAFVRSTVIDLAADESKVLNLALTVSKDGK